MAQPKIYWTDTGTNDIRKSNLDGTDLEVLVTGTNTPRGIEIDLGTSQFYFVDGHSNRIQKANLDGSGLSNVRTGLGNPVDLDLDRDNQHIYFSDIGTHKIQRMNYDGSGLVDILTGLNNPPYMELDLVNSMIYWSDFDDRTINRANLDGSNVETIVCNVQAMLDLDVCNYKIYYIQARGNRTLYRANMNGTCIEVITAYDHFAKSLSLDVVNQKLYHFNMATNRIWKSNFDATGLEILDPVLIGASVISTDIINPTPNCISAQPSGCTITGLDFDGDGFTVCEGDCDDNNPDIYPGNTEICDGLDNDCNGEVDEVIQDQDGDGISDCLDNCPQEPNPDQMDGDCDGVGDVCDLWDGCDDTIDSDGDGIPDCIDQDEIANWTCQNKANKVLVCHHPPGNPDNVQTICISVNALQTHLDHGDFIGECGQVSGPCTEDQGLQAFDYGPTMQSIQKLQVYPNPTTDVLNIVLGVPPITSWEAQLIDMNGRMVQLYNGQKGEGNAELHVQHLPSGIYILNVRSGLESTQVKVAIQ